MGSARAGLGRGGRPEPQARRGRGWDARTSFWGACKKVAFPPDAVVGCRSAGETSGRTDLEQWTHAEKVCQTFITVVEPGTLLYC